MMDYKFSFSVTKKHEEVHQLWDLRFSWQWRFKLWSSGLWHYEVM